MGMIYISMKRIFGGIYAPILLRRKQLEPNIPFSPTSKPEKIRVASSSAERAIHQFRNKPSF